MTLYEWMVLAALAFSYTFWLGIGYYIVVHFVGKYW